MTRYDKKPELLLYGDADLGAESALLAQFAPKNTSAFDLVKRDNAELEKKPTCRQSIVERIDERLSALAASKGISHVSDEVSDFMEDALRVRLVQVAQNTTKNSSQRTDVNRSAFESYGVESDPRRKVRELNLRKQAEQDERAEKKRQALLTLARAGDHKRKAPEIPSAALVARKEDAERAAAETSNAAARNALGICNKSLKWAEMASHDMLKTENTEPTNISVKQQNNQRPMHPPPFKPTVYTLTKRDCERVKN